MIFSTTHLIKWALGSLLYFGWFGLFVGIRTEHYVLWCLVMGMYFAHVRSRAWVQALGVWVAYWMLYDSLRIAPNYTVNPVHIREPYDIDKWLFGVRMGEEVLTLNEWCALHTHPVLDLLAGFLYISWVPLPLALAAWLLWRQPVLYLRFAWCFFFVNLLGFAIYYLYPAAPPWYVSMYGFDFNPDVPRSAAGLDRVDQLTGTPIFQRIYTRNSNVFAAIPSLHSAYPLVGWLYARKSGNRIWAWLFGIVSVGIWITAIYTGHHYVIDVLAGIAVALTGYVLFERSRHLVPALRDQD